MSSSMIEGAADELARRAGESAPLLQAEVWRPIESAPQNGTALFVRGRDWGNPNGRLHYNFAAWIDGRWRPVGDDTLDLLYLTHWLDTDGSYRVGGVDR